MGLEASTFKNLETNESLIKFCSSEPLSTFDPIWNKLFSHSIKPVLNKEDDFILELSVEKLRGELILNNLETKNVSALIEVFTSRAKELHTSVQTSDQIFIWQAYNCLFIIRSIIKYLLCSLNEEEARLHFRRDVGNNIVGSRTNGEANGIPYQNYDNSLELLMDSLCHLLLELPITKSTYMLHLEAVNTFIVILSQQIFITNKPPYRLLQYRFLMGIDSETSIELTKRLLENYLDGSKPPYPVWNTSGNGSIVIGMASGIWNMLRKGAGYSPTDDEVMDDLKGHNLARQSLYLLLLLINHSTGERKNSKTSNPYLCAVKTFKNSSENKDFVPEPSLPPSNSAAKNPSPFKISYAKLYARICDQIHTDDTTLLLYMLIFGNQEFMSYIMARSDIENLIIPILKTIYNAKSASHHIYMSLIVLLILSQEELFNRQIHDIMLKNITWYTDRNLPEITLGGLIILVIVRTIQHNILKMRDKYLHTNCLAALANMSSQFRSLNSYVAQRILSVFEILGKRYVKLTNKAKASAENPGSSVGQRQQNESTQDLDVLDEVLRMILEILNSTLTNSLTQNQQLVYTLLYKKEVFEPFRSQDSTQDLIANLDTVINYFTKRLGTDHNNLTTSQVMECVQEGILHWKPEILKKFPELHFRYVEEESPEAFFVPYIWTLIYQRSGIRWNSPVMELYSLEPEVCV